MHLNKSRAVRGVLKMQRHGFQHIGPQVVPRFSLREDGMAKSTSVKPAFFRVADLEDEFYLLRISERSRKCSAGKFLISAYIRTNIDLQVGGCP